MSIDTDGLVYQQEKERVMLFENYRRGLPNHKIPENAKIIYAPEVDALGIAKPRVGDIVRGRVEYMVGEDGSLRRTGEKKKRRKFNKPH